MAPDSLRSTLDKLRVDPEASSERPYLEAALRRMGYTEKEIQERLAVEAPPPTEYRLVKPVLAAAPPKTQSPFEDLTLAFQEAEPVEFDAVEAQNEEFEEIQDFSVPATAPEEELLEFEVSFEEVPEPGAQAGAKGRRKGGMLWEETQLPEPGTEGGEPLEFAAAEAPAAQPDYTIDTFGTSDSGAGAGEPRTRVRVRRVRASSRQEAEAKVAGKGRRVIKSIPVDIVERWGPGESREKGAR